MTDEKGGSVLMWLTQREVFFFFMRKFQTHCGMVLTIENIRNLEK